MVMGLPHCRHSKLQLLNCRYVGIKNPDCQIDNLHCDQIIIITSLAKEVIFLVAFVCLSVDNDTQKVTNGLG